jgi:hypothetical protein
MPQRSGGFSRFESSLPSAGFEFRNSRYGAGSCATALEQPDKSLRPDWPTCERRIVDSLDARTAVLDRSRMAVSWLACASGFARHPAGAAPVQCEPNNAGDDEMNRHYSRDDLQDGEVEA